MAWNQFVYDLSPPPPPLLPNLPFLSTTRCLTIPHSLWDRERERETQDILLNKQYMFISKGELDSRKM